MESLVRDKIVDEFAKWTAFRATRGIAKERAYSTLDDADFSNLLQINLGPINRAQFDRWHRTEAENLAHIHPDIELGWVVKLLNIYLKTRCYVGSDGREGIREVIHPPIDNILMKGLKKVDRSTSGLDYRDVALDKRLPAHVKKNLVKEGLSSFKAIYRIKTYEQYQKIILACDLIAALKECSLVEVDQFWEGTTY